MPNDETTPPNTRSLLPRGGQAPTLTQVAEAVSLLEHVVVGSFGRSNEGLVERVRNIEAKARDLVEEKNRLAQRVADLESAQKSRQDVLGFIRATFQIVGWGFVLIVLAAIGNFVGRMFGQP